MTWPLITVFTTRLAGHPFGDAYEYLRHIWWFKYALQHGQPLFFHPLLAYPDGLAGGWLWSVPLQSFPAWLFAFVMPLPAAFNLTLLLFLALNGWAVYFLTLYLLNLRPPLRVQRGRAKLSVGRGWGLSGVGFFAKCGLRGRTQHLFHTCLSLLQQAFLPQPDGFQPPAIKNLPLRGGWGGVAPNNHLAAWLAGLIYMAYPTFQGHIAAAHIGLLAQWGIPLYVYALFRLRETGSRRYVLWGVLCFVLSLLGSPLMLIYALLPITALLIIVAAYKTLNTKTQRHKENLSYVSASLRFKLRIFRHGPVKRVLGVITLGSLGSLVLILPGLLDTGAVPVQLEGDITFSADALAVVTPSFQNPLFKALDYPARVLGVDPFEKMAYIGIVAGLLAVISVWRRPESRWWFGLGLIVWILSLGPVLKLFDQPVHLTVGGYETLFTLPWAFLMNLPLLDISRTPARFNFTLALAVAVMAGYGVQVLMARLTPADTQLRVPTRRLWASARIVLVLVLSVFILSEFLFFWEGSTPNLPTITGEMPPVISALSERNDIRAVFDIPWSHPLTDKEAMFLQIGHQKPLLAGHIARATPVNPAKLTLLEQTLDPALLNAAGADIIILHKQWDDAQGVTESFVRSHLLDVLYEDDAFAVFEVPATDDVPTFTTLPLADTSIANRGDSFLYVPEAGWTMLTGELSGNDRRAVLSLNDQAIYRWTVSGEAEIRVPVYLSQSGFYTLSLMADPPCTRSDNPALKCRTFEVANLSFEPLQAAAEVNLVEFERGIRLVSSRVQHKGDQLTVWLNWNFDQPRLESDVRFVHVLDSAGNLIAQKDNSLGALPVGGWSEEVVIDLPAEIPIGKYTVEVGWYEYPTIAPFRVVEDGEASLKIGTLEISP